MDGNSLDCLDQIDQLLSRPNQVWLLAAGISKDAGLPLMWDLTARVVELANGKDHWDVLQALLAELPKSAHIEHVLSQLGDYSALARRSAKQKVIIDQAEYSVEKLELVHQAIVADIANIIRWGYKTEKGAAPIIGTEKYPIVTVEYHQQFVKALLDTRQAGVSERRTPVQLFTTNYDTLLEDALALEHHAYWDGFEGGAIAFRSHRFGNASPDSGCRANVIKLHGSIDWHMGIDGYVYRVRDFDCYPSTEKRVLIYPQATKYVATQRDPFASQFALFRESLSSSKETVLAICGYSFGDEHINQEIELAMSLPNNKTTLIAFCFEENELPSTLTAWRMELWGKRVYVLSPKGVYVGDQGPLYPPANPLIPHDWWSFVGMIRFLENGSDGSV